MTNIPDKLFETVGFISQKLATKKYAIRGSSGLVLQGYDLNVDDIDIVCTKEVALECNTIFQDFVLEPVEYKESEKFKSYYGKFKINDILVEVYGDWEILDPKGVWTHAFNGSEVIVIDIKGFKVPVTPVDTELIMFAKMGRWNAFHKIKKEQVRLRDEGQLTMFSA